ncbi:Cytochrome c oxidase assembly protein cox15 [Microbotryomycetes sp. JL221]|nr:Cytochrome c oxidase assembly protein cox15 [Microbotryomycetes sp. JL221]
MPMVSRVRANGEFGCCAAVRGSAHGAKLRFLAFTHERSPSRPVYNAVAGSNHAQAASDVLIVNNDIIDHEIKRPFVVLGGGSANSINTLSKVTIIVHIGARSDALISSSLAKRLSFAHGSNRDIAASEFAGVRRTYASYLTRRSQSTAALSGEQARVATDSTSSSTAPDPPEIPLTKPVVAKYLFVIAGMVFAIVVVGGVTRLTESGLSITEWNVVSGIQYPLTAEAWEQEFAKYRATPEWRINNSRMSLEEFKSIYFWEWSHRILGRVIGLAFLLPIPYFAMRRKLGQRAAVKLLTIGTLIGAQGALGWYMVKSGLDEKSVQDLGGVPRVSQYRLAAHLGMAFTVFAACLRFGLGFGRDWKILHGGKNKLGAGLAGLSSPAESIRVLNSNKIVGRTRVIVTALTGLVFLTALSGAFVAGLDAGLVYNEFPLMGGRLAPPSSELIAKHYTRKPDGSDWWRNFFENPTTTQFDHRVLAMTTFTSIVSLFLFARRPHIRSALPPTTYRLIKGTMHMSVLQVALGISTLLYMVPIHLAATHQAGSLILLSLTLATGASLRRVPSRVLSELVRLKRVSPQAIHSLKH